MVHEFFFQDHSRGVLRSLLEETSRLFALSGGYRRPGVIICHRGTRLIMLHIPGLSDDAKGMKS